MWRVGETLLVPGKGIMVVMTPTDEAYTTAPPVDALLKLTFPDGTTHDGTIADLDLPWMYMGMMAMTVAGVEDVPLGTLVTVS